MLDYKKALSQDTIQAFINEKRTFDINIGQIINKAWEDATANIGNTLVIGLIMGSLSILGPWLMAGLYIGKYDERVNNKPFEIGSLFRGFDHGMPIFMYLLLTIGLMFAAMIIPVMFIGVFAALAEQSAIFGILAGVFYLLLIVAIILLSTSLFFSLPFIIFGGMEAMDAMKASAKIIRNNLLTVFLFTFVAGLVAQLGVLACFVGIYFTLPVAYFAYYYAFADVFKIESTDKDATDQIIEHLL